MSRRSMVPWILAGLLLAAYGLSRANDREVRLTAEVSSADHELGEGYFSLGGDATFVVKPGSDLFRFLSSHRGQKITILLTEGESRHLSKLKR
ncbi:MAG TPA: hypothetical protein VLD67_03985 [Vicinamibacterales bacterium]|nr:hypothetical protein [Vicinamibacterales bacterium]